ncbi:unnamed protein product [Adineta ricciae]|uniref:Uncharacterized protein n=1 Tax=Adineta ricciae TaxID=249248 RepID=A0A815UHL3_ADIRI|nr:unnamed protein product [Adineta ricciae]
MLKWAVTPSRLNADGFDHDDGIQHEQNYDLLTLQAILSQYQLPCLARLINDDTNEINDNYCLLLCETTDPYLLVSTEAERFSIPLSFDGLFAPVEHGVTRYNILQSVRVLQSHLKAQSSSSSTTTTTGFSYFTTLQPCTAFSNAAFRRIRSGTILEQCRAPVISCRSPSPANSTSSSTSSKRLRALLANIPHSFNKHLLPQHQNSRLFKNQLPPSDYLEVKSVQNDEHFCLKSESTGVFVPVYNHLPTNATRRSSLLPCSSPFSSSFSNQIQGLYTAELLCQLAHQYPLITELVVSRTLEESAPNDVRYPFRRLTLHRLVEQHTRIIAFDMKNYAFIELDTSNALDVYRVEHEDTLFQRYQAQLRWCDSHMSTFRSQIKTVVHSSNGTAMFVQTTPVQGQQYHLHRNSAPSTTTATTTSSNTTSPISKHVPQTIFTSTDSISSARSRARTPLSTTTKFHTATDRPKSQTTRTNAPVRKDVRVYFNHSTIQKQFALPARPMIKQTSFNKKHSPYRTNSTESDSLDGDGDAEDVYQCTAL